MINVYYIVPSLINAGPIRVVLDIVKNLDRKAYNPIIIALSKHKLTNRYCRDWFEQLGLSIIECDYSKWILQLRTRYVAKQIHNFFPSNSIVHAHGYYPTRILSYMKDINSIVTLHNICKEDYVMSKGRLMGRYMSYSFLRALKNITHSVAISHTVEDWYRTICNKINISTVYNGVDIDDRYTTEDVNELRNQVRSELKVDKDSKVLIYPASFNSRKNHAYLIEELKASTRRDFVVIFVGHGSTEEYCRELAVNDSRFIFLGYKMDMFRYYVASDYLITSSKSEGFGLILAEAMSYGLPCITSDIPVHKELVRSIFNDDKELTFSITEHGDLLAKVEKNLDVYYDRNLIRLKSISLYSSSVMAKGYEQIYKSFVLL